MTQLACPVSNDKPAPNLQQTAEASVFNPATIREFTPQNYDISNTVGISASRQTNAFANPIVEFKRRYAGKRVVQ